MDDSMTQVDDALLPTDILFRSDSGAWQGFHLEKEGIGISSGSNKYPWVDSQWDLGEMFTRK